MANYSIRPAPRFGFGATLAILSAGGGLFASCAGHPIWGLVLAVGRAAAGGHRPDAVEFQARSRRAGEHSSGDPRRVGRDRGDRRDGVQGRAVAGIAVYFPRFHLMPAASRALPNVPKRRLAAP